MRYLFTKVIILLLALFPLSLYAFSVPAKPAHFVSDFAGMLSASQIADLETKISNFEKSTTNEIAVVIIPSLDGDTIENVAQNIFTKWGIGKKEKNNGVLFLISLTDRQTRIHTGYGVEGDLTDLGTSYIQNDVVVPAFKNGDYFGGINGAVDKMIEALGGNNIVPANYSSNSTVDSFSNMPWEFILFVFFIVFQILVAILGRSKSWWGGGVLGGVIALVVWHFFINSLLMAIPVIIFFIGGGLFFDYMVSKAYTQKKSSGVFPWWFGGGGGGFGGGGFGGFGGGMSGGGGSSSRW